MNKVRLATILFLSLGTIIFALVIFCSYGFKPAFLIKEGSGQLKERVQENKKIIGAQYSDQSYFLSAIKQTRAEIISGEVSGLIVPHHLLAKDIMAASFAGLREKKYTKIILLSPDHFQLGKSNISTTDRNFSTVFGEIKSDHILVKQIKELPFVSEGDFFYREHGLGAELPFIKYYFPGAAITALTFKPTASKIELDQLVELLKKELTPDSLIIQSTDFSHYLEPAEAEIYDKEAINALEQSDPEKILILKQPENIDSIAAQYIQARLQKEFFKAGLNILDHRNSQSYTDEVVSSSTSYIAAAYLKNTDENKLPLIASSSESKNQAELIFVGDVMLSRYIGDLMDKNNDYNYPFALIKDYLGSADLVFGNLESPISKNGKSAGHLYSFRADPRAAAGLKEAGFSVVSLANNHAFDYGLEAFTETISNLKNENIAYVGGGLNYLEAHRGYDREVNGTKITFLGYTDLLPLSEEASEEKAGYAFPDSSQMVKDIKAAKERSDLVVVTFHWGQEYKTVHNKHQEIMAEQAVEAGASLIIGHHPHVVQDVEEYKGVTIAYSLGNFIFDQNFSAETKNGLTLKVLIANKEIKSIKKIPIKFNRNFQPYLSD